MDTKKDHYEVLGVQRTATDQEIKKAYRKLSKQCHPDKMAGKPEKEVKDAEERFKEINEAYSILSDPEKRKLYDQFGHDMGNSRMSGGYPGDIDDIFNSMRNQAGFDPFNPFGGRQRQYGPEPTTVEAWLTLEEISSGVKKTFKYKVNRRCGHCNGRKYVESEGGKMEMCKKCNGVGMTHEQRGPMTFMTTCGHCGGTGHIIVNPCKKCNGTGYEKEDRTIDIDFPKGIQSNQIMQFEGGGNETMVNGVSMVGDLLVIVREKRHEAFQREGDDLHCIVEPSIYESILGESVSVKGLDGKMNKFKLNVGAETGDTFRLRGLGMPIMNSDSRGDLIVHVRNRMPKKLTEDEIKLLNKLKDGKK